MLMSHSGRQFAPMRWGLIPSWSKDPKISSKLINSRSETAAEKPSFRHSGRHETKDPREGICVLRLDGTLLVKRVAGYPGRQLEVSSDNQAYSPFTIDLKDPPEDFGVIGRVLWSFRSH